MSASANHGVQRQQPAANHFPPSQSGSATRQQAAPYLDHGQQDLLLAALNSQATGRDTQAAHNTFDTTDAHSDYPTQPTMNDTGLFMSPAQAHLDHSANDFTPDLDYLDDNFDFENADLGGEMIGALPGSTADSVGPEQHEKRKSPDEADDEEEEGGAKRQEGEKGSKKPGRKPLTSEPTTKRKAQNRAAQRAFRERKEKHLKDLETKVTDLTKAHDADKQENSLLKAQIERLQVELREYRKRLSLNSGGGAGRSPPLAPTNGTRSSSNSLSGNNFQFEFPKFGSLPGSQILGNQGASSGSTPNSNRSSNTPPARSPTNNTSYTSQQYSRQNSQGRSMSPKNITGTTTGSPTEMPSYNPSSFNSFSTANNMHGFASTLPQMAPNPNDPFGDLFSPSVLKSASMDSSNYFQNNTRQLSGNNLGQFNDTAGGDSTAGLNRVFQFNSNSSTSDSASPSASSASQWNANHNTSSCDTSPEPSHDSPATKVKDGDTFCDKINPISNVQKPSQTQNQSFTNNTDSNYFNTNYSMPSADTFDPVLFGDYRENNDGGLGGGDFTGGFFDEALNPQGTFDLGSPSNLFGILDSPQQQNMNLGVPNSGAANAPTPSKSLMAEIEKTCQGGDDDYGLPGSKSQQQGQNVFNGEGNMISCNNIWNQLQSNPDFQEGKFDLDGLCSELRSKARCSESGVMVDQDHVDAALRKLGKKDEKSGKENTGPATLMFEQQSWDNVLKKLGGNRAL